MAKNCYSLIVLAGVIDAEKPYSTNLPYVVEFHILYQTVNKDPTSLKFAVGEKISRNFILRMNFINTAKLVINTNNNVIKNKLL